MDSGSGMLKAGAILLLFEVGLESRVSEMRQVGVSSLLVALIGATLRKVSPEGEGRPPAPPTAWR